MNPLGPNHRSVAWQPQMILKVFRVTRRMPAYQSIVRELARDPWFVRKVCPDATTVNPEFVWPLVVQAVIGLRASLHWPPPPMNDDSIERLTGVPEFGRALDRAGVCKRDADGLYDLSTLYPLLQFTETRAERRGKHLRERRRELRKLGLKNQKNAMKLAKPIPKWRAVKS